MISSGESGKKMRIQDIADILDGELICGEEIRENFVDDVVAGDLLSDVLAVQKENYVLLTGLTNSQIVRTAEITNAACVVITLNKQPQQAAIVSAQRAGIPIILSPCSLFEACCRLNQKMEGICDAGAAGKADSSGP